MWAQQERLVAEAHHTCLCTLLLREVSTQATPAACCCRLLLSVCQTALGREQAHEAGRTIRAHMDALHGSSDYSLYFYTSPYKRGLQTYEGIR